MVNDIRKELRIRYTQTYLTLKSHLKLDDDVIHNDDVIRNNTYVEHFFVCWTG